ncbi:unnamed protein product [Spirodela intermedia]|uniref:Uncharacterized protein n=1 Tax=Spirodela intermedia TaxID=51605 RepID=A0A7I8IBK3_SPIIN|nr:unnamed protein product [Spirodela intermedia]CAA6654422.1 unnamed protein product [Spirodela intermedia]
MTMIEEEDEADHSKPIMKMRKRLFTNSSGKKQKEKDEKANLADIMKKSESVLLMTLFEELKTILLEVHIRKDLVFEEGSKWE